jgi:hypothetical protein
MINLINKILSRFNFKLVSTKPVSLVDETMKFLNRTEYSGRLCGVHDVDITKEIPHDYYVGDITFVKDSKTHKTYFRDNFRMEQKGDKYHCDYNGRDKYFCDYDGDPNDPWKKMYEESRFTKEELQEKLNEN